MKVYLAAMYQHMEAMKLRREEFKAAGIGCTAQWIDNKEDSFKDSLHDAAQMDLNDIDAAEVFVGYTLKKGTMFSSGGRMVELGYAIAKGKWIILIGDRENVFCHLEYICVVSSTDEAIQVIKNLQVQNRVH